MDEIRKEMEQDVKNAGDDGVAGDVARIVLQSYDIFIAAKKIAYSLNPNATESLVLGVYDRLSKRIDGE